MKFKVVKGIHWGAVTVKDVEMRKMERYATTGTWWFEDQIATLVCACGKEWELAVDGINKHALVDCGCGAGMKQAKDYNTGARRRGRPVRGEKHLPVTLSLPLGLLIRLNAEAENGESSLSQLAVSRLVAWDDLKRTAVKVAMWADANGLECDELTRLNEVLVENS